MKLLLLLFVSVALAQEEGALKILHEARKEVVLTGSYVAEATQYTDYGSSRTGVNEAAYKVRSIPSTKHGGQISVTSNSYIYQIACLTSMLYRSRYQELSLYLLTMALPSNQGALYMPGAWYSSYVSSLASYKGDTSSVWLLRLGKYENGTDDRLAASTPGGYAFAWEAQLSRTVNANQGATNKPMVSAMGGLIRKPQLSNIYLNWEGSVMVGFKANPWVTDAHGNKALYLQTLVSFTIMTGFYHHVGYGILLVDLRASIDDQLDMRLGDSPEDTDTAQAASWSTLTKLSTKISYSF